MNCSHIVEILDSRNITQLGEGERGEVEAHLSACPDCARDWALHKAFAVLPDLIEPAGFAATCRARVATGSVSDRRQRMRSRFVVVGVLAAVAAAATMLSFALRTPEQTPTVTTATEEPVVPLAPVERETVAAAVVPAIPATEAAAVPVPGAPAPAIESPKFTVQLQAVRNDATEQASRAAINALHTAVARELRAVPGLTLIEADLAGSAPDVSVNYRVSVSGGTGTGRNLFKAQVTAQELGPDGKMRSANGTVTDGVAACPGADVSQLANCSDPSTIAARVVNGFRMSLFPPDPAVSGLLRARLLDSKLRPDERLRALSDLAMRFKELPGATSALKDPLVVRGAIDLATSTSNPAQRAQVWRTMRSVRHPDLIEPLVAAAIQDVDVDVRQEAVVTLADFGNDARARTALETIAKEDTRPLVRALAQRGLSGEAFWKEYVSGSLKDASRSDAERVEAFIYHVILRGKMVESIWYATPQETRDVLDEDAIRALAVVLPRTLASRPRDMSQKVQALMNVAQIIEHPAIDRMVFDNLETGVEPLAWLQIAGGMMRRRSDQPELRAALQKIAAEHEKPEVRAFAERVLQAPSPPAVANPSPAG